MIQYLYSGNMEVRGKERRIKNQIFPEREREGESKINLFQLGI